MSEATLKEDTEKKADEGPGLRRILRYDQVFDIRTYSTKLIKTTRNDSHRLDKKKPLLVVRRIIDHKGRHVATEIDLKSRRLANVLIEINHDVDGLSLKKDPPMAEPYLLYHNRKAIEAKLLECKQTASASPDTDPAMQDLIIDLESTMHFINEEYGSTITNFASLSEANDITWKILWTLFPPNILVYHYHELTEQHQVLRMKRMEIKYSNTRPPWWNIECDVVADDGLQFGISREPLKLEVDMFEGTKKITNLPLYPFKYRDDQTEIREKLIKRGKVFVKLAGAQFWNSGGVAMKEKRNTEFKTMNVKLKMFGRSMVDSKAFRSYNGNCLFIPNVHRRLDRDKLTDEELLLCSPVALGYSFGVKSWCGFSVSDLGDITWGHEAFDNLVISPAQKQVIHSLVRQHSTPYNDSPNNGFDDIVPGKGRGLIGLLNGRPGCGKTLTAEAVAEVTKRPLYSVSAGELGIEPDKVDEKLNHVLHLAHLWNAVLLLDEADVFLQRRDTLDVKRNALVSIFLRQLEYFEGILILTTNRLAECDEAFESRIHFSIHYPDLGVDARERIWWTFIKKAHGVDGVVPLSKGFEEEQVRWLAEKELNGRQIRNVVSSARSVARDGGEVLGMEHVKTVLAVAQAWKEAVAGGL